MECIVKFDVVHGQDVKSLRGLVFVDGHALPTTEQLTEMFKDMKYEVTPDRTEPMRFTPVQPSAGYDHIRIRELDTGEKKYTEDRDLKNIVSNLMPNPNRPI
ncbi:hypothetical protein [Paenibacillus sp. WLX2291]|uniref:hypothetical protein n=1 Tax=Paenibacillus sp. WLX2291 TaxID=3296934 RepID=UPI0039846156